MLMYAITNDKSNAFKISLCKTQHVDNPIQWVENVNFINSKYLHL